MTRLYPLAALLLLAIACSSGGNRANAEIVSKNSLHLGIEQKVPDEFAVGAQFPVELSFTNAQRAEGTRPKATLRGPSVAVTGSISTVDSSRFDNWEGREVFGNVDFDSLNWTVLTRVDFRCDRLGEGEYGIILSAFDDDGEETILTGSGRVRCVEFMASGLPTEVSTTGPDSTPGLIFDTPTPAPSAARPTAEAGSGQLVYPCDAISTALAASILGNPVEPVDQTFKETALICNYWLPEEPEVTSFKANLAVVREAPSFRSLDAAFLSDKGYADEQADYIVFNDDEGILADLLAAGVVEETRHSYAIYRGEPDPVLGRLAIMSRTAILTGAGGGVSIRAYLTDFDVYVDVDIFAEPPIDHDLTPGPYVWPTIDEYERRALELAHTLIKAVEVGLRQ